MLSHTTVGTNDMPRAAAFYDALFALVGGKRFFEMDRGIGWGVKPGQPMFSVFKPFDGQPATVGNGQMVALSVASQELVHALHAKALELGAQDEGAPGLRGGNYYGCYFRDLDGNKIAAFSYQK
jgi:catechol 2,3-dioxygenase-like lactoylglutathione lyase family enzyme